MLNGNLFSDRGANPLKCASNIINVAPATHPFNFKCFSVRVWRLIKPKRY